MSELEPIFTTACKISLASKGAKSDAKIYLHSVEIPDTFCSKTSFTRLIPHSNKNPIQSKHKFVQIFLISIDLQIEGRLIGQLV